MLEYVVAATGTHTFNGADGTSSFAKVTEFVPSSIVAATIILKNFLDILFTSEIYFICISYNIFL